ncbi:hypothetical protein [Thioalkalivibrio sp.]|uniref:hypothetical protein n=1 Tax=Thioalkalivibrio sp. TaxID=2093813 RepID=UPI003974C0A5
MYPDELQEAASRLYHYATTGEFVSELNGYEAYERPIPGTSFVAVRMFAEDESRPAAIRITHDGEIVAWATLDDALEILDVSAPEILVRMAALT